MIRVGASRGACIPLVGLPPARPRNVIRETKATKGQEAGQGHAQGQVQGRARVGAYRARAGKKTWLFCQAPEFSSFL